MTTRLRRHGYVSSAAESRISSTASSPLSLRLLGCHVNCRYNAHFSPPPQVVYNIHDRHCEYYRIIMQIIT